MLLPAALLPLATLPEALLPLVLLLPRFPAALLVLPMLLDATLPDPTLLDALLADALLPDPILPDELLPDATLPDALMPDTTLPDALLPALARLPLLAKLAPVGLLPVPVLTVLMEPAPLPLLLGSLPPLTETVGRAEALLPAAERLSVPLFELPDGELVIDAAVVLVLTVLFAPAPVLMDTLLDGSLLTTGPLLPALERLLPAPVPSWFVPVWPPVRLVPV